MADVSSMAKDAVAVLALSAITLTALAVVSGYKTSGALDLQGNTSADKFIAGLAIFGTFMAIIVLALVGKIIVRIFKPGKD